MNTLRILSLLSFALIFSGCSSISQSDQDAPSVEYGITELNGSKFDQPIAYVRFINGRMNGDGPVNQWTIGINDGQLGSVTSTRRAGPEAFMRLEQALYQSLAGSTLKSASGQSFKCVKDGQTVVVVKKLD